MRRHLPAARPPPGPAGRTASLAPALTGLGLGLLALGPGLGRGFLLSYDMVFVPRMPFSAALLGLTGGPPRAVPSDAVIAVASLALPADIVQKIILLLIFVLACSGAAALLDSAWAPRSTDGSVVGGAPLLARLAAGVCYAWNPYVAERLQLGQWALLLGYAALPWVVRVLCAGPERVRLGRLVCVMIPAAIGGVAALSVTALAAVPAALASPGGRARRLLTVLAALALLSLPWLIPALAVPVHTDPRGIDAFAPRADTPFGRVGSLLLLSGIWNPRAVPPGFRGAASAFWLLLVVASAFGYVLWVRPRRLRSATGSRRGAVEAPPSLVAPPSLLSPGGAAPRARTGLAIAALAGLVIAAVAAASPGRAALRDLVTAWPGFAVLRDGQKFLAPLALAEAVGLGALAAGVSREVRVRAAPDHPARAALAAMVVLAPVVLLPGMAWGLGGRLRPAEYPADWLRARQVIDGDPARGSVLLLPWAAYRSYPWNSGQPVFDPWARFTGREVISNDGLAVGNLNLAQESADSIRLNRIVTSRGPLTRALRAAGVRYVVVDAGPLLARAGTPAGQDARALAAQARLPGAQLVIASRDLLLFRLPQSAGSTPVAVGAKLLFSQHIVFSPASLLRLGRCCRCGDSPLPRGGVQVQGGSPCHVSH
ncbi:MAG TPA: hypothetical protein VGR98_06390 [Streptosporangiaceae bacterium]|nr:hypothetical protein [Streptosporangiaceae bacterium]